MNRARGELFAGACLARDEHGARCGGGAADDFLDLRHHVAAPDEPFGRRRRRKLALQQRDLPRELPAIGGGAHAHQEFVAEEWLLHEVDGAKLHRFHGGVDGAESGHHDEAGVDVDVAKLA